ncbi:hypothetical protein ACFWFZ_20310 [Streptomyces sp. NPDC060232]|uniref:hypothetical protein n=1 Tax=Streptomyces sp. NPDC060232 TaxID=3347079 RepID=UPI00364B4E35
MSAGGARDRTGTFHPLAEQVAGCTGTPPRALLDHVCEDLLAHATGDTLGDDAAVAAVERPAQP